MLASIAVITGCKPGQCADPLTCIIGVKSKCGCASTFDGRSQVLIQPAGSASYCSPICAKIKGSSLVCGDNTNGPGPQNSAYCRSSASQKTASCVCSSGFEFKVNPTLQTDPLTGTKYYTGSCVCSAAGVYTVPSPFGGSSTCEGESDSATNSNLPTRRSAGHSI
jgi:hypothetical protein